MNTTNKRNVPRWERPLVRERQGKEGSGASILGFCILPEKVSPVLFRLATALCVAQQQLATLLFPARHVPRP